jgi:hypothetical protein
VAGQLGETDSRKLSSLIQCAHQRSRRFEFFVDLFMFFQFRGRRKATSLGLGVLALLRRLSGRSMVIGAGPLVPLEHRDPRVDEESTLGSSHAATSPPPEASHPAKASSDAEESHELKSRMAHLDLVYWRFCAGSPADPWSSGRDRLFRLNFSWICLCSFNFAVAERRPSIFLNLFLRAARPTPGPLMRALN